MISSQSLATTSGPATGSTALTSLVNASGVPLFATGDELTVGGSKGGIAVPETTFVVGATGTTLDDLAAYLEQVLGIDTAAATGTPGARVENGSLVVESNVGDIFLLGTHAWQIRHT